jgi:hypothetical protein
MIGKSTKRSPFIGRRASSDAYLQTAARRRSADSCGCAMGAWFVAVALVTSVLWYAWHWRLMSLSAGAVALRIFIWSVLAGFAGKVVGVLLYRHIKQPLAD